MSYGDKVLSRVMQPGFAVMVVGILLVYLAGVLTRKVPEESRQKMRLILKGVGTAMTVVGAVLIFI